MTTEPRYGTCPECGAPTLPGETCRDNLNGLLAIESELSQRAGDRESELGAEVLVAHFLAVASYGLQHPESMGYTVASLDALRRSLESVLAGDKDLAAVSGAVRAGAAAAGRVTRRGGDPVPKWPIERWPLDVVYVIDGGASGYLTRVWEWAAATIAALQDA